MPLSATQKEVLNRALAVLASDMAFSSLDLNLPGHSERIVEVPWAAQYLKPGSRMLDIGFAMSSLDWLGLLLHMREKADCDLQAVDIVRPARVASRYPENWRESALAVPVTIGDIRRLTSFETEFDLVTCISTIEHIGFDTASTDDPDSAFARGKTPAEVASDRAHDVNAKVLASFYRALKKGGRAIITTPMGRGGPTLLKDSLGLYTRQWEYEAHSWNDLKSQPGWTVIAEQFFGLDSDSDCWAEASWPAALADKSSELQPHASGCALLVLQKQ